MAEPLRAGRVAIDPGTPGALTIGADQATASGNTTLLTPAAGKALRVYYAMYNPKGAVEAAFRFGAAGTRWLRADVPANSVVAKDFGAQRYLQGAVNEALVLNLSAAVTTNWTVFYQEV